MTCLSTGIANADFAVLTIIIERLILVMFLSTHDRGLHQFLPFGTCTLSSTTDRKMPIRTESYHVDLHQVLDQKILSVPFSCSIISKGFHRLFTDLCRPRFLIRSLDTRIESRENWKPVRNERFDGVGDSDGDKYSLALLPLLPRVSLGVSVACVEYQRLWTV